MENRRQMMAEDVFRPGELKMKQKQNNLTKFLVPQQ
jgi:hypothetical protein